MRNKYCANTERQGNTMLRHKRIKTSFHNESLRTNSNQKRIERGRPKSQRANFRSERSKSQLKEDFEIIRSEMLDKQSNRIKQEDNLQKYAQKYQAEEEKLEKILSELQKKNHQLKQINSNKVRDIWKKHEREIEKYKNDYEYQLKECLKFRQEKDRIKRRIQEKEEAAENLKSQCNKVRINYESRMEGNFEFYNKNRCKG